MAEDIFIQLASYRDPQLGPTVLDAIQQASDPSRLHFCIAWQHDETERADEVFGALPSSARLTILDIPHTESHGACWARHRIQQHYSGERYTLQLDSHHRFVPQWDDLCISMVQDLQAAGFEKPLLTAYVPSFDPERDPEARVPDPWYLTFDRFIPEGAVFFRPAAVPNWEQRTQPMRARFYSAHFAFTLGEFAREVQHNPAFYFHGEEISLAARAFTHGYDLFHPHRVICWHEYTRKGRSKHWDDHRDWGDANIASHNLNRRLFGMDQYRDQPEAVAEEQHGPFGFGQARTLEDYERFSGLCFRRRALTQAALDGREPEPADNTGVPYAAFAASTIPRYTHCLDIWLDRVALDDYDFWCVAFKDANGVTLFRQDAMPEEITRVKQDSGGFGKVWRTFDTEVQPRSWQVWPHSREHGWCPPIVGTLG